MESTDYKLTRVSMVMLGVQDVSRALGIYRDKLGLEVQRALPGFAFLSAGTISLCLSEPAAKMRGAVAGAGEVVFSVEDVAAAYEALRAKGVQFTHPPRCVSPTTWLANFDDPDGNHFSISGAAGAPPPGIERQA